MSIDLILYIGPYLEIETQIKEITIDKCLNHDPSPGKFCSTCGVELTNRFQKTTQEIPEIEYDDELCRCPCPPILNNKRFYHFIPNVILYFNRETTFDNPLHSNQIVNLENINIIKEKEIFKEFYKKQIENFKNLGTNPIVCWGFVKSCH